MEVQPVVIIGPLSPAFFSLSQRTSRLTHTGRGRCAKRVASAVVPTSFGADTLMLDTGTGCGTRRHRVSILTWGID
jgi:hypothetical protein